MKNVYKTIKKPFLMLAPMAGYTDSAFRLICKEMGADIVVTEMISSDAIAHGKFQVTKDKLQTNSKNQRPKRILVASKNKNTAGLLSFFEAERPIIFQLFGKNPENFAKAARWLCDNIKPDGIDINMGCPARKVVGSDHGVALLKNIDLACAIVREVKKNANCPVSVKTRLGWTNDDEILEFAPRLKEAGIDTITIHGRTYKDGFKNKARWENIYKVKEMFGDKLIVIGNGDITENSNIKYQISNKSEITNSKNLLDGIAIGRAAFGKPWIFDKLKVKSQKIKIKESTSCTDIIDNKEQSILTIFNVILHHAELAHETKGEHGIIEFRKHLLVYFKCFPSAKALRKMAVGVKNFSDVERLLEKCKVY